jgi:F-type H+-transporting ATPase subunit gamma
MATLRDIQRRIRSVQSTQKITKAMKLVAAAKLRRAQERITAARPYAIKMGELLSGLVGRAEGDAHPLLARRDTGRRRLVVITADKGLCGAFNSNILRASLAFLREVGNVDVTLVVVGKKARDFYRRRQWQVKGEMLGFFDRLAYAHAQELAGGLIRDYLEGEVDEVHLLYNEFRSVAVQRVRRQQLLPIEAQTEPPAPGMGGDYIYEPSAEAILAALLPRHVTTQVFRALMESLAGEYGARMTAMESASKNAKEMIDVLTIQYNKARQERITRELLDIVGGAEALRQAVEA